MISFFFINLLNLCRQWRAKWLKAQELTAREKAYHFFYLWDHPDFRKARLNPIRRMWQVWNITSWEHYSIAFLQAPGEAFERALRPALGLRWAFATKWLIGKSMWGMAILWSATYYGQGHSWQCSNVIVFLVRTLLLWWLDKEWWLEVQDVQASHYALWRVLPQEESQVGENSSIWLLWQWIQQE